MLNEGYSYIEGLFEKDRSNSSVEIEITENLKTKIDEYAHYLLKSNFPYDTLCWTLAELQLIFEKGHKNYSEFEVKKREKKIFDSTLKYDEMCWLIGSFKVYLEENNLYP
jgi:hypothetical protein